MLILWLLNLSRTKSTVIIALVVSSSLLCVCVDEIVDISVANRQGYHRPIEAGE